MEHKISQLKDIWENDTSGFVSEVLFLLFVLLKPLYLRPSGNIGLADMCMAASGFILLISELRKIISEKSIEKPDPDRHREKSVPRRRQIIDAIQNILYPQDYPWYIFLAFVIVINLVWYEICRTPDILVHMIFWIYNGMAIWIWRRLEGRCSNQCTNLLSHVALVLKLDILIQFLIFISGRGRVLVEPWGATRYMGSFNDPNQLAFFLFTAILLIYLNEAKRWANGFRPYLQIGETGIDSRIGDSTIKSQKEKLISRTRATFIITNADGRNSIATSLISAVLVLIMIIAAKSTGIMLGVCVFFFLLWCCSIHSLVQRGRISARVLAVSVIIVTLAVAAILFLIWPEPDFNVQVVEYNMLTRFQDKLWKISNGGLKDLILDRGADKILAYPQYLLYGAGEGAYERFAAAGPVNEIHSSILSILFCYGIIPTAAMLLWFRNTLKAKNRWQLCACIALIIECLLLVNYRQLLFWFVFLA